MLERGASIFDVRDLASRMALGALLENVRLAALELGFATRVKLDPERHDPVLVSRPARPAEIGLAAGPGFAAVGSASY